ncbi:MAG: ABC transporter ATP-binding protein [Deltaproteobacteria bacterium]|nr:ABC transporter ATP-binding protein [Deltaproteobacteria bacterium]HCH64275.1 ABC transporter ATP-binding protein [Deltaproteobacteria bacterium]
MIEVSHLSRFYGNHRAVDDVSFTIASNTIVGFLGLNGAGKTTTLKVIAGLLPPSAGTVRVDGEDLADAPESFRQRIGFLPETPPLYIEQTVREFLRFVGRLRGMPASEVEARLPEVMTRCQLAGREDWVIGQLSHGYRKRVGIAQAIIHKPKLVILDEPISGLDPVQIVEMRRVIRGLAQECTVLVSSHILSEIEQTCDRILVLQGGRLVFEGEGETLRARNEGSTVLSLTVRGAADVAQSIVEAQADATIVELTETDGDLLNIRIELTEDHREALIHALVHAGLGLRRLEQEGDELEDVFVALTKSASLSGGDR